MKIAFETKGFCFQADDSGVNLDAKAGDTLLSANASWVEIYDAYSRATGFIPKKIPRPARPATEEVV
jgi:hypothetical protein